MIDQIIDYNKDFVTRKDYEKYPTDKYPDISHFHHEMIARGVTDETLDTIQKCGIDLHH